MEEDDETEYINFTRDRRALIDLDEAESIKVNRAHVNFLLHKNLSANVLIHRGFVMSCFLRSTVLKRLQ